MPRHASDSDLKTIMNTQSSISQPPAANRGWLVTFSGTGINLALGILYTWSMFKGAIETEFGWKGSQLNDPYALCCLVFALAMIFAGRCQDRFGPRLTASIGGLLVGAGFLLCSTTNSYAIWLLYEYYDGENAQSRIRRWNS